MKKPRVGTKAPRALVVKELAAAAGGAPTGAMVLVDPYLPQQHNETIVRDRRRLKRAR